MSSIFILVFTLSLCLRSTGEREVDFILPDNLLKINLGISFNARQKCQVSTADWRVMYVIKLPPRITMTDEVEIDCITLVALKPGLSNEMCFRLRDTILKFAGQHKKQLNKLSKVIEEIYELIPEIPSDFRERRGLLDIGGRVLKGLFGVAVNDDLKALKATMKKINEANYDAMSSYQHEVENMHSFEKLVVDRLNNFKYIVNDSTRLVNHAMETFRGQEIELQILRKIMTTAVANLTDFVILYTELTELRDSIESLVGGKLRNQLISSTMIQNTLTNIKQAIIEKGWDDFQLCHDLSPNWFVSNAQYTAARVGQLLHVVLKYPLTNRALIDAFTFYEIKTFPVPLGGDSRHVSVIKGLPKYIAFAQLSRESQYLTFDVLPQCHDGHVYKAHGFESVARRFSDEGCISAILLGSIKNVTDTCRFDVLLEKLNPEMYQINSSHVLVINIQNISVVCQGTNYTGYINRTIQGCQGLCVLAPPCNCHWYTKHFIIHRRFKDCLSPEENEVKVYGVNLALLSQFFSEDKVAKILAETFLQKEVQIILPKVKLQSDMKSALQLDDKFAYDLKKLSRKMIDGEKVYNNLEQMIRDNDFEDDDDIESSIYDFSWKTWLMLSTSVLAIVTFVFVGILCARMRMLSIAIALSVNAKRVEARVETFEYVFNYFAKPEVNTTSGNNTIVTDFTFVVSSNEVTLIILCVLLIVLGVWSYRKLKIQEPRSEVFIQVGHDEDFITVLWCKLKHSAPRTSSRTALFNRSACQASFGPRFVSNGQARTSMTDSEV